MYKNKLKIFLVTLKFFKQTIRKWQKQWKLELFLKLFFWPTKQRSLIKYCVLPTLKPTVSSRMLPKYRYDWIKLTVFYFPVVEQRDIKIG
jgi:hypothetical protein